MTSTTLFRTLCILLICLPLGLAAQSKSNTTYTAKSKTNQTAASKANKSNAAKKAEEPPKVVKKLDSVSFLKEILGAKYSKADKSWVLPRSEDNAALFNNDAEGGLFVAVDTMIKRNVGVHQEQWVLFIVEGYIFNFATLVKTDEGWELKDMKYSLHQGAPGEYAPIDFNFEMISQKTFVSIKEMWMNGDVIIEKWLLFDPFTSKSAGKFKMAVEPTSDELPETYSYYQTKNVAYKAGKGILPDLLFSQNLQEKAKGKKAVKTDKTIRYIWNEKTANYELAK
jgi:hypothetical protein